jgi:hypothetical protein
MNSDYGIHLIVASLELRLTNKGKPLDFNKNNQIKDDLSAANFSQKNQLIKLILIFFKYKFAKKDRSIFSN